MRHPQDLLIVLPRLPEGSLSDSQRLTAPMPHPRGRLTY